MPTEKILSTNHLLDIFSNGKDGQAIVIQTGRGGFVRTRTVKVSSIEKLDLETEAWEHNKKHKKGLKPKAKGLSEEFTIPRE